MLGLLAIRVLQDRASPLLPITSRESNIPTDYRVAAGEHQSFGREMDANELQGCIFETALKL